MNLDFYYAYNRVCLPYVGRVFEARAFGPIFREDIKTLHRDVSVSFML
jgi:hypothetical protein